MTTKLERRAGHEAHLRNNVFPKYVAFNAEETESVAQRVEWDAQHADARARAFALVDSGVKEQVPEGLSLLIGLRCIRSAEQVVKDSNGALDAAEVTGAALNGIETLLTNHFLRSAAWVASDFGISIDKLAPAMERAQVSLLKRKA